MKLRQHKKGLGLLLVTGLALLFATMLLIIFSSPATLEETIGVKQYNFLNVNEDVEAANFYLEQSLPYATQRAEDSLYISSGIPSTSFGNGRGFNSACGTHIYNLYTTEFSTCLPEFRNAFTSYTEQNLKRYLDSYLPLTLMSQLRVDVISTPAQNTVVLAQAPPYGISLSSKITLLPEELSYPRGSLGGYGAEQPIICSTGTCFSEVARYQHELYATAGLRLPYVQGGQSPYSYEDTLADQQDNEESIFLGVELSPTQSGRLSLTEAGFDGSGWVWWIGKHSSVLDLLERKSVDVLYNSFVSSATILCQQSSEEYQDCTAEYVQEILQAGDLLFVEDQGRPTHVMISLGGEEVSHSRPGIGLQIEIIPSEYLSAQDSSILAIIRPNYQPNGQDSLFGSTNGNSSSCIVPVDFTQVNLESFRTKGVLSNTKTILSDFEQKIVDSNQEQTIATAAGEFKQLPEEFIRAMIYKESGPDKFAYLTGSTIQAPGNSYYGPMQVGALACAQVAQDYGSDSAFHCDWNDLRQGGFESARMSILAGSAYLDWLINTPSNKYVNPDNPNYYFVALSYNAGPGSTNEIIEESSRRLGIPPTQIQWRDITFQDVAKGLINTGESWAKEPEKWKEVYEYPNFVNYVLSNYCGGDIFAQYRSGESLLYYQAQLQTSSSLDLNRMSLIEDFVEEVQTCNDHLESCITTKINEFNSQHLGVLTISRQGETESFAYEFADQALNCLKNEQTNCLCEFDLPLSSQTTIGPLEEGEQPTFNGPFVSTPIETNTLDSSISGVQLEFTSDGTLSIGEQTQNGFRTIEPLLTLPLGLTSYFRTGRGNIAYLTPDFTQNTLSLSFEDGTRWTTGQNNITHLTLSKEGNFSFGSLGANDRSQAIIEYAEQYLGTGYHITSRDGPLRDCRAEDAQAGRCNTQCGSFVSSVFLYTLGTRDAYGPEIVPRGNGNQKCSLTNNLLEPFSDENLLQVGDLFSSNGRSEAAQLYGHTGIFVGWGSVDTPARTNSDGTPYCYKHFNPSPLSGQLEPVFIHSIGPVCYNTLTQLVEEQGRNEMLFCRHKLLEHTQAEQEALETIEATEEAPLEWFPYNEEEHHPLLCRDNRHYYRFHTSFGNGADPITFSLYLNDSVAPTILESDIGLRTCGSQDVIALEWSYPIDSEELYTFAIQPTCQDECPQNFSLLASSAQVTTVSNPEELEVLNQLFVRETQTRRIYSYLLNRVDGQLLEANSSYSFDILGYDHYLNEPNSLPEELSITTPPLTPVELAIQARTEGTLLEGLVDSATTEIGNLLGTCTDASGEDFGFIIQDVYGDLSPIDDVNQSSGGSQS